MSRLLIKYIYLLHINIQLIIYSLNQQTLSFIQTSSELVNFQSGTNRFVETSYNLKTSMVSFNSDNKHCRTESVFRNKEYFPLSLVYFQLFKKCIQICIPNSSQFTKSQQPCCGKWPLKVVMAYACYSSCFSHLLPSFLDLEAPTPIEMESSMLPIISQDRSFLL